MVAVSRAQLGPVDPVLVRQLHELATEAVTAERSVFAGFLPSPGSLLGRSVEVMRLFLPLVSRLHRLAEDHRGTVRPDGFGVFLGAVVAELGDDFVAAVQDHLDTLASPRAAVLIDSGTGVDGRDTGRGRRRGPGAWAARLARGLGRPPSGVYRVPDRDESGSRALSQVRDPEVNLAADALARAVDDVLGVFRVLRTETARYLGGPDLRREPVDAHRGLIGPEGPPAPAFSSRSSSSC